MALLKTPPVEVILIKSAPSLYLYLTAFAASSGLFTIPLEGPGSEVNDLFNELVESPCPPEEAIVVPVSYTHLTLPTNREV